MKMPASLFLPLIFVCSQLCRFRSFRKCRLLTQAFYLALPERNDLFGK